MAEPIYQLFDSLRPDEYQALASDIKKRGVLVPVEVDEDGNILDGHHRQKIADSLGIEAPRIVRKFDSEAEKREHVLKINLLRRHLGPVSWAKAFERLLEERGVERRRGPKSQEGNSATVAQIAQEVGVSKRTAFHRLQVADQLATRPDLAEKVDRGELEAKRATRIIREETAKEQTLSRPTPDLPVTLDIREGDFREVLQDVEPESIDAIITDPPYPAEFIGLFDDLGALAAKLLKPNGVLVCLAGQVHLPDYIRHLGTHLKYRWTGCYQTTGQHTRVHARKVATAWKPVLVYQREDATEQRFFLDLFRSEGDDKNHHHWGQSESGIAAMVDRLSSPGDTVLDPFLGGGTTALVCRDLKRRFIGCDTDAFAVATAKQRMTR